MLIRTDAITGAVRQSIYRRLATASEPASYTWTLSDYRRVAGGIVSYSGVDAADPVDVHAAQKQETASTAVTAPSIVTTSPATLLLHFAAVDAEAMMSPPAGMTERWEATSPNFSNTRDALASLSDGPQPSAGATGPRTATATSAGRNIGALVALRPAATDPDTTPPETTIDSAPPAVSGSSSATFTFSSSEAGSTFECQLDAGGFTTCTSPAEYGGLANGSHTFQVRATDASNNQDQTAAGYTWEVQVATSAITVVGSTSSASSSGRNSVTLNRPAGTQTADVLVASIVLNDDDAITAPAGWTEIRQDSIVDALRQALYRRVVSASEPGSYTWTLPDFRRIAAGMTAYRGVSPTVPVEAHDAQIQGTATTAVTAPSITTTVPDTRLLHFAVVNADGTLAPPAGMTARWEANSPNTSSTRDALASLSDVARPDAGATGARTASSSTAGRNIGAAVALRPSGPPDETPPDTTINSGPTGTVNSSTATFTFSSNEPNSTFQCRLDGGAFTACTSPRTYAGLANGSHTFEVRAIDLSGNIDATPDSRTWAVSVTAAPILAGAGDISGCSNDGDEQTAQLLDRIAATNESVDVFTAGDNVYNEGTLSQFNNCYQPTWGRHRDRTRPSPGNHEYLTPGASGYYTYFGSRAGDPSKGYYQYTVGGWQVIALNSNCGAVGGCGSTSPQVNWLRNALAASTAECTVAYWHHPRFSSGKNSGSNSTYQPFWQALYDGGADLVLSGHHHLYERFAPQTPAGQADPNFGIRQFTVGNGGKSLYSFGTIAANSQFRYNGAFGVLKLTLRSGSYDWQEIRTGDTVIDSGSGNCHGKPPAPAAISAVEAGSPGEEDAPVVDDGPGSSGRSRPVAPERDATAPPAAASRLARRRAARGRAPASPGRR